MRTIRFLALSILLLFLSLTAAMADGGFTPQNLWAVVSHLPEDSPRVNLRSGPSEDAASLAKLYSGTYVWVIREVESGWVEVEVGTKPAQALHGYMNMGYLDFAMETVQPYAPMLTVANDGGEGIILRTAMQMEDAASLGLLPNGTQVSVLAVLPGDWYFVQTGGITGYVAKLGFYEDLGGYEQPENNTVSAETWNGPSGAYQTAPWPVAIHEYAGVVNNPDPLDRLNLRIAPDENAPSLGRYYNGVRFIINANKDDQWARVSIGGLEGYVNRKYITVEEMDAVPSAMPVVTVKGPGSEGVELRQQPSATADMLDVCTDGTQVILMGFTKEWAHVIVGEQIGFLPVDSLR